MLPTRIPTLAALAAVCVAPMSVHAVEYTPPGTTGWWQVQDAATYVELCTASGPACDIAAGTRVQVIDFGTSPATRSIDTVRGGSDPGTSASPLFKLVFRIVPSAEDQAFGGPFVTVSCPAGQLALSGSCDALGGTDPEFFAVEGIWSGLGDRLSRCDFPMDNGVLTEPTIRTACVDESSFAR